MSGNGDVMQAVPVNRRTVLALAGLASSFGTLAQKKPAFARIGVVWAGDRPSNSGPAGTMQHFRDRLEQLSWVEGRNLGIETRFVGDSVDASREIAQLLALKVDVIVATSSPIATTARSMTNSVPIVFGVLGDPVRMGLVDSLALPNRNLTGIYASVSDQAGKRLQLLHEAIGGQGRIGVLWLRVAPISQEYSLTRAAADKLGVQVVDVAVDTVEGFDAPLLQAKSAGVAGITVMTEPRIRSRHRRLAATLIKHRLPSIAAHADYARLGGLMSYGPSGVEILNRMADLVAKVLAGTRPAVIPAEQNTLFKLSLNTRVARAVGVVFPKALLAYSDEVIQ